MKRIVAFLNITARNTRQCLRSNRGTVTVGTAQSYEIIIRAANQLPDDGDADLHSDLMLFPAHGFLARGLRCDPELR